jgi:hypothetical protein
MKDIQEGRKEGRKDMKDIQEGRTWRISRKEGHEGYPGRKDMKDTKEGRI